MKVSLFAVRARRVGCFCLVLGYVPFLPPIQGGTLMQGNRVIFTNAAR